MQASVLIQTICFYFILFYFILFTDTILFTDAVVDADTKIFISSYFMIYVIRDIMNKRNLVERTTFH